MDKRKIAIVDGNEAAAHVAYRVNEVCAIYPITPSSPMGELADQWAVERRTNLWNTVPQVVELQSEGGAAGAVHGSLQGGALTTTFTASQGLLLMIPNMYKIAGELTSTVFYVAARSLAAQALSIFGDHSDVMAVRSTGFALLCASCVQEAHDLALIAQAATLESRVPFIHFFDGFRTSHEINKIELLSDQDMRALISDELVWAHRARALNPDRPFVRGVAQNPDVYFQARESVNPYYERAPAVVQRAMDAFKKRTGRPYHLFDYFGDPQAERVLVLMGSGVEAAREAVEHLNERGEPVGVVQVHLYRPFSTEDFLKALPDTVKVVAVLDRTKEPGACGEPLYQDVVTVLSQAYSQGKRKTLPRIIGGRYGLSSKEFTPAMVKAALDELKKKRPKHPFTLGITDDVSHTSLAVDPDFRVSAPGVTQAVFFGLGADGTVGANKNSIKIIGEETDFYTQGYFVYDSKKSGSRTTSHLRFGPRPIRSTYLIQQASFVGCHQFNFLEKIDVLKVAAPGAVFLLNSPYGPEDVWDHLPGPVQEQILGKKLKFYVIDAYRMALENEMGTRINTMMQTCFFAISGVLPRQEAIEKIKGAIEKTYGKKGQEVVRKNFEAVDGTLANLFEVELPATTAGPALPSAVPPQAPEFVRNVTAMMMADRGDELPVSALPVDGTYPSGTTRWEKRNISQFVPIWEPDLCIQCGNCSFVCPHSCIRAKLYPEPALTGAPQGFKSAPLRGKGYPDQRYTLQVYVEDCTGCTLCVDVCPAKSKEVSGKKAINMGHKEPILAQERDSVQFFEALPQVERGRIDFSTVRGVQYLEPLFEFSGACAGCGETPYLKLVTQLFGDRMIVANATGCSSIYGGNLPTTPWSFNRQGRGPAWSNSLFEDNAEFGFGLRVSADKQLQQASELVEALREQIGADLAEEILSAPQRTEGQLIAQRERVTQLKEQLQALQDPRARHLLTLAGHLVRRSVWTVGGDGWAYDIGYGGLDHVLASGRDVNILVLDTEVYSNTGGQASKATPLGAVAKFAAAGKAVGKKDLALMAIAYGNVYVARVALGANPQQTLLALRQAEAYPGPSLIIAYSHCIMQGINMEHGLRQQELAVKSGCWPLFRYNPELKNVGQNPMELDSARPSVPLERYAYNELRYKMLTYTNPERAKQLLALAKADVEAKWAMYEYLARREAPAASAPPADGNHDAPLQEKTS